ncbi:hypothetical protein DESC_600087 [Desulfosarcina cetonica]|nr:hypothetical protein DESC_600087 [Desulfosarcina cetonica]
MNIGIPVVFLDVKNGYASRFFQKSGHALIPVQIDGALPASFHPVPQRGLGNHHVTGLVGVAIGRAGGLLLAIENNPTRCCREKIFQAGNGKPMLMDQRLDPLDLADIGLRVATVVGPRLPDGADEPVFFVFADALVRQSHPLGDVVDPVGDFRLAFKIHRLAYPNLWFGMGQ